VTLQSLPWQREMDAGWKPYVILNLDFHLAVSAVINKENF